MDAPWIDMRRYAYPPTAAAQSHLVQQSAGNSSSSNTPHIPGVYPPTSLANDLLARERERLERLGKIAVLVFFKLEANGTFASSCLLPAIG